MYISLREIQRRTGISRVSLSRYAKEHADELQQYALGRDRYRVYHESTIPMWERWKEQGLHKRGRRNE